MAPHTPGSFFALSSYVYVSGRFSLSVTLIVKLQPIVFPFTSVTSTSTVVVPTEIGRASCRERLATEEIVLATPQLSVAGALNVTLAPHNLGSLFTLIVS